MIELYSHQQELIEELRGHLKNHRQVLCQAATGFGKTALASFMIKSAMEKDKRIIFQVHRRELVHQVSKTLLDIEVPHGFIAAGYPYEEGKQCYVAIINTLHARIKKHKAPPPPDILIVDEAHLSLASTWSKVIEWANCYVIGLTATPWRLNGQGLGKHYSAMACGKSVEWLIDNKYLSDFRIFAPSKLDTSGFHIRNGEYAIEDVEGEMMKPKLVGDVVENWKRYAGGQRTIVFAPTVKVSEEVVSQFNQAGIPAAHLDANTPRHSRKGIVEAFADGKYYVLSNVSIMTEGFDLSSFVGRSVPVEAVILYTPTMSLSKYLQMIGRALRPKPYPAIIIDHANNCRMHGDPTDDFGWSLNDRPKKKRKEAEEPKEKFRLCKECFHYHKPVPACPNCGHVYEVKEREIEKEDGELEEINWRLKRKLRKKEEWMCKSIEELTELGKARNYKYPRHWAKHIWAARQTSRTASGQR